MIRNLKFLELSFVSALASNWDFHNTDVKEVITVSFPFHIASGIGIELNQWRQVPVRFFLKVAIAFRNNNVCPIIVQIVDSLNICYLDHFI